MLGPDGRIGHVEVELGDAVITLFDAQPGWPPAPAHLRIYVASTQDMFNRALASGARAVTRPTELAFGVPGVQAWRACSMLIAAEIQRSSTRNRQAWSSAECELMPH